MFTLDTNKGKTELKYLFVEYKHYFNINFNYLTKQKVSAHVFLVLELINTFPNEYLKLQQNSIIKE